MVAQMTGYPAELLDLDLDLEADLGVDTVKQAEVFAAVRQRFDVPRDENLQLRDFPTLTHVIGWIRDKTGLAPSSPAPTAPASAPAAPGPAAAAPDAAPGQGDEVTEAVVSVVAQMTGYPAELLDLDLDLEADLGVDTVKQAEVFAAVRQRFDVARDENLQLRDFPTLTHVIGWIRDKTGLAPSSPAPTAPASAPAAPGPAAAAPDAAPGQGDEVTEAVVSVVAQMTGYPAELLDLDLDLEADLGVDTVKQAEVFAAVRQRFDVPRDENLQLRDFPTLTHVIGWIRDRTGTQVAPSAPGAHAQETPAPQRACQHDRGQLRGRRPCPAPGAGAGAAPGPEPVRPHGDHPRGHPGDRHARRGRRRRRAGLEAGQGRRERPRARSRRAHRGRRRAGRGVARRRPDRGRLLARRARRRGPPRAARPGRLARGAAAAGQGAPRDGSPALRRRTLPGHRHPARRLPRVRRRRRDGPDGRRGDGVRQGLQTRTARGPGQGGRLPAQPQDRRAGGPAARGDDVGPRLRRGRSRRRPSLGGRARRPSLPGVRRSPTGGRRHHSRARQHGRGDRGGRQHRRSDHRRPGPDERRELPPARPHPGARPLRPRPARLPG